MTTRLTFPLGTLLDVACLAAISHAIRTNAPVEFVFNDALITVQPKPAT